MEDAMFEVSVWKNKNGNHITFLLNKLIWRASGDAFEYGMPDDYTITLLMGDFEFTGVVSEDGKTMRWDDGDVWSKQNIDMKDVKSIVQKHKKGEGPVAKKKRILVRKARQRQEKIKRKKAPRIIETSSEEEDSTTTEEEDEVEMQEVWVNRNISFNHEVETRLYIQEEQFSDSEDDSDSYDTEDEYYYYESSDNEYMSENSDVEYMSPGGYDEDGINYQNAFEEAVAFQNSQRADFIRDETPEYEYVEREVKGEDEDTECPFWYSKLNQNLKKYIKSLIGDAISSSRDLENLLMDSIGTDRKDIQNLLIWWFSDEDEEMEDEEEEEEDETTEDEKMEEHEDDEDSEEEEDSTSKETDEEMGERNSTPPKRMNAQIDLFKQIQNVGGRKEEKTDQVIENNMKNNNDDENNRTKEPTIKKETEEEMKTTIVIKMEGVICEEKNNEEKKKARVSIEFGYSDLDEMGSPCSDLTSPSETSREELVSDPQDIGGAELTSELENPEVTPLSPITPLSPMPFPDNDEYDGDAEGDLDDDELKRKQNLVAMHESYRHGGSVVVEKKHYSQKKVQRLSAPRQITKKFRLGSIIISQTNPRVGHESQSSIGGGDLSENSSPVNLLRGIGRIQSLNRMGSMDLQGTLKPTPIITSEGRLSISLPMHGDRKQLLSPRMVDFDFLSAPSDTEDLKEEPKFPTNRSKLMRRRSSLEEAMLAEVLKREKLLESGSPVTTQKSTRDRKRGLGNSHPVRPNDMHMFEVEKQQHHAASVLPLNSPGVDYHEYKGTKHKKLSTKQRKLAGRRKTPLPVKRNKHFKVNYKPVSVNPNAKNIGNGHVIESNSPVAGTQVSRSEGTLDLGEKKNFKEKKKRRHTPFPKRPPHAPNTYVNQQVLSNTTESNSFIYSSKSPPNTPKRPSHLTNVKNKSKEKKSKKNYTNLNLRKNKKSKSENDFSSSGGEIDLLNQVEDESSNTNNNNNHKQTNHHQFDKAKAILERANTLTKDYNKAASPRKKSFGLGAKKQIKETRDHIGLQIQRSREKRKMTAKVVSEPENSEPPGNLVTQENLHLFNDDAYNEMKAEMQAQKSLIEKTLLEIGKATASNKEDVSENSEAGKKKRKRKRKSFNLGTR